MATGSGARGAYPVREALLACRGYFVHAALFSALMNILYLAPTLYMLQVYDRVIPTRGTATLVALSGALCAAVATVACLDFVRSRVLIRAGLRIEQKLAGQILDELGARSASSASNATSAALRHLDSLRHALTGSVALALFDAPWAPIYIIACFLLHPALGALALTGCISLTLLTWLNERATSALTRAAGHAARSSYEGIDRFLRGGAVFGPLGMRPALARRHIVARASASDSAMRASLASVAYLAIIKAIRLLLQSLALGLGAYLAISQAISPGAIFAASLLIARALAPLELFAGAWRGFALSRNAYRALLELFDSRPEQTPRLKLPAPHGRLELDRASVRSPDGTAVLLQEISLSVEPGEMLGVVGASGAGKSTLARALVGAIPLSGGSIRIDGASLTDWAEEQLATMFGYAAQQPSLHDGTIKENISRFRPDMESDLVDAEVVRVARLCGAHDMILKLPKGYDTRITSDASGLSVGQAQRISLARALFSRPPVIILDEPNAGLDAESEACLIRALNELRRASVTIVVIAHHGEIISMADRILVMRNGEVGLFGPREAVLSHLRGPTARSPVAQAC